MPVGEDMHLSLHFSYPVHGLAHILRAPECPRLGGRRSGAQPHLATAFLRVPGQGFGPLWSLVSLFIPQGRAGFFGKLRQAVGLGFVSQG